MSRRRTPLSPAWSVVLGVLAAVILGPALAIGAILCVALYRLYKK